MITRKQLAEDLLKLSYDISKVADALGYYGGLSEWCDHARTLMTTSRLVKYWGQEMLEDNDC